MHARDPHGILKKIFKLFLKLGGKFVQTNIQNLEQISSKETAIRSKNEEYKFEKTVVASGGFQSNLLINWGKIFLLILKEATMFTLKEKII